MLKIKLVPTGKKHGIQYRIGVSEAKSKNNGSQVAFIGFYRPKSKELVYDKEQLTHWQKQGAQLTEGLQKILNVWKNSSNS